MWLLPLENFKGRPLQKVILALYRSRSTGERSGFCVRYLSLVLIYSFYTVLGSGCASTSDEVDPKKLAAEPPPARVFRVPFEVVWRAAQLSLRYPVQINNIDSGIIETEWVRASEGYRPPYPTKPPSPGLRFKLRLVFEKGFSEGKPSIKVSAIKRQERLVDFFTDPQAVPSDRIEEQLLLYRIEREVKIEDGIKKASLKSDKDKAGEKGKEPSSKTSDADSEINDFLNGGSSEKAPAKGRSKK